MGGEGFPLRPQTGEGSAVDGREFRLQPILERAQGVVDHLAQQRALAFLQDDLHDAKGHPLRPVRREGARMGHQVLTGFIGHAGGDLCHRAAGLQKGAFGRLVVGQRWKDAVDRFIDDNVDRPRN